MYELSDPTDSAASRSKIWDTIRDATLKQTERLDMLPRTPVGWEDGAARRTPQHAVSGDGLSWGTPAGASWSCLIWMAAAAWGGAGFGTANVRTNLCASMKCGCSLRLARWWDPEDTPSRSWPLGESVGLPGRHTLLAASEGGYRSERPALLRCRARDVSAWPSVRGGWRACGEVTAE